MRTQTTAAGVFLLVALCGLVMFGVSGVEAGAVGEPGCAGVDYDGEGESSDPYQISTPQELQCITEEPDAHYELVSDVNATETEGWNDNRGFDPIGSNERFTGSLDGNGYSILGLTIDREGTQNGLFAETDSGAEIRDIVFEDARIESDRHAAVVVASMRGGTIEQVHVRDSLVEKVYHQSSGSDEIGGIVGITWAGSVIESSVERTAVLNPGGDDTGGLVGDHNSGGAEILRSYARDVTVHCGSSCGGVVGEFDSDGEETTLIKNSYALNVDVTADSGGGGGLVGDFDTSNPNQHPF